MSSAATSARGRLIGSFSSRGTMDCTSSAWNVVYADFPVAIAWKTTNASAPRTSPTIRYCGRCRRAALRRSNMSTGGGPPTKARAREEGHPVLVRQVQLPRVLDADDLHLGWDEQEDRVQRGRLPARRAAADEHGLPVLDRQPQVRHHVEAHRLEPDQVEGRERVLPEPPHGEGGAALRDVLPQRRLEARAVRDRRVAHGLGDAEVLPAPLREPDDELIELPVGR